MNIANFEKYLNTVSGNFKKAIKIEWLNPDETVDCEFTNSIYDMRVDLNVNYQNGSRRTCTVTLNNDNNKFPIDFNNIWLGQKFKLWMGVYIDEETPYYFPQGVFYVSNPEDVYQPSTRTVTINGVDKWAFLDGKLHGKLSGVYQTNIGVNLYDATRDLLKQSCGAPISISLQGDDALDDALSEYFEMEYDEDEYTCTYTENQGWEFVQTHQHMETNITFKAKKNTMASFTHEICNSINHVFRITINGTIVVDFEEGGENTGTKVYKFFLSRGDTLKISHYDSKGSKPLFYIREIDVEPFYQPIDPVVPLISPHFLSNPAGHACRSRTWRRGYRCASAQGSCFQPSSAWVLRLGCTG